MNGELVNSASCIYTEAALKYQLWVSVSITGRYLSIGCEVQLWTVCELFSTCDFSGVETFQFKLINLCVIHGPIQTGSNNYLSLFITMFFLKAGPSEGRDLVSLFGFEIVGWAK